MSKPISKQPWLDKQVGEKVQQIFWRVIKPIGIHRNMNECILKSILKK